MNVSIRRGMSVWSDLYDEAMEQFTLLINNHPDSAVFPMHVACGDILGSRGELDEAVADEERAIDVVGTAAKATPTFQMVEIFQAEARYERIINAIELYLASWGIKPIFLSGLLVGSD